MNILKNNLLFLKTLQNYPHIYSQLKFQNDKLYLNNLEIDLTKIDIPSILNENALNNFDKLTIDDFTKLLEIASKINDIIPLNTSNMTLEEEQKSNPKIQNFKVIKKVREDGSILEYPYYIDESNHLHVLFNYGNVTAKDLYDHLERKMQNVELTPDYANPNMREANKLEANLIDNLDESKRTYLNPEHGIYAKNNTLYTYNVNGTLNQNNYGEEEPTQESTYNDEFNAQSIEVNPKSQEPVAKIITLEEYLLLIKYSTPTETPDIALFEAFMEDVTKYQDYLSEKILNVLFNYQKALEQIELRTDTTSQELEALNRYKESL